MDKHSGSKVRKLYQGSVIAFVCSIALPAHSQLALSTEVFGAASHQQQEGESGYSLQLGNTTNLGYQYSTGPHRFNTGYSISLRRTYLDNFGRDTSYTGTTRYSYRPIPLVDANLGHTVRAASTEESLLFDFTDYDLRHSLNGGIGLNLTPGERVRTRIELQGTQALDEDLDRQGHQVTGRVINSYQVSSIASARLTTGRAIQWDANSKRTSTNDSLQLGYQRVLPNGNASGNVGLNFYEAGNTRRTLVSAGVNRNWVGDIAQTSVSYNRAISDTLTELSFETIDFDPDNPPESPDDLETETEVVQLQQATLVDAINVAYRSQGLCERCSYQLNAGFSTQRVLFSGPRTFVYTGGAGLGFRLSNRENLNARYQWRANAEKLTGGPDEQQHRINLSWDRRLASQVQARASLEHGWASESDNNRTTARLGVRIGLIN
ncbi:MAG: hypothetical protein LAT65_20080 [Saccharospirillum sp.]|nr:hypothetical protein [Saccharospirillum sp.]